MCVKASVVAEMVKNLPAMQETWVWSQGWEDALEEGMETHSSILAWSIPWTEEPGGLLFMGLQRFRHDWATNTTYKNVSFLLLLFISSTTDQLKNIFNFFLDLWLSVFSPPTILILFHEVECCSVLKGLFVSYCQILSLKPNPQANGISRWGLWEVLGHEGGALMNGINALVMEDSFLHVRTQRKKTAFPEPKAGSSPDSESAGALILDVF